MEGLSTSRMLKNLLNFFNFKTIRIHVEEKSQMFFYSWLKT